VNNRAPDGTFLARLIISKPFRLGNSKANPQINQIMKTKYLANLQPTPKLEKKMSYGKALLIALLGKPY